MTQPPFGPPPPSQGGQPPYGGGQPSYGQPSYGQEGGFGQPGHGQSGGYEQPYSGQPYGGQPYGAPGGTPFGGPQGPYGPPSKKSPVPWIIGGLVMLLVLGGLGLFLLLNDDEPTPVAITQTTEQTTQTSATEETTEESTEESTESTEETSDDLVFDGSPDAAAAFLDLMASGDYPTAFGMLTEDVRADYTDAQDFADDFFDTIEATAISSSTLADAYGHGNHDDIIFDLATDSGTNAVLLAVTEEAGVLKVFDFETA